jgi:uncharacterized protein with HEPN domain
MDKDPQIYIEHISQSISLLNEYLSGISQNEFNKSMKFQDLTCRRLEIIGEAVKNIPIEFKNKYPHVKWKNIAGLRDILIHQYFGIDLMLLWNVVVKDIPELDKDLKEIKTAEKWK